MNEKTITMYGSCVASNIFSLAREKDILNFKLPNRFFQINPISLLRSDPLDFLFSFEPMGRFNTAISSAKMDIRKNVFDILRRSKTDFAVIEMASLYYDLLRIEYGNRQYLLTWMCELRDFNKQSLFSILDEIGAKYQVINSRDYLEQIDPVMKIFCEKLLDFFDPGQIIFVETIPARLCVRKNGILDCVGKENIDADIKYMTFVSQTFLKYMPGCHCIHTLNPMLSSWENVFGISPVHYDNSYYEYAYKAVEIISRKTEKESEILKELQIQYSNKMEELKDKATDQLLHIYRKQRMENSYDHFRREVIDSGKVPFLDAVEKFSYLSNTEMHLYEIGGALQI